MEPGAQRSKVGRGSGAHRDEADRPFTVLADAGRLLSWSAGPERRVGVCLVMGNRSPSSSCGAHVVPSSDQSGKGAESFGHFSFHTALYSCLSLGFRGGSGVTSASTLARFRPLETTGLAAQTSIVQSSGSIVIT